MKRLFTIFLSLVLCSLPLVAQFGRISGELRYDYRYQDYLAGVSLTKYINKSPMLNLRTNGNVLSPRFINYSLSTSLTANYSTTSSEYFNYSGSQYTWNMYNCNLNILPASLFRFRLAARENAYTIKSESDFSSDHSGDRQQEQRAEVSVQQIPWLPSMTLSYVRSRTFSTTGNIYDFTNQTLAFSASGASDSSGTYNLTALMSDFRVSESDGVDKFISLQFSASRPISDLHQVSISSEYNKYFGYSNLSGTLGYSGVLSDRLRISTGLDVSSAISSYLQSRSFGLSQSASYVINSNFQCNGGVTGYLATSQRGERNDLYKNISASSSLHHYRTIAGFGVSNSLSFGYTLQPAGGNFHSFYTGLANSFTRQIGGFSTSADYVFSFSAIRSFYNYDVIGNSGGFSMSGTLPRQILSQTSFHFNENHYRGIEVLYRNNGSLVFSQRFSGSFVALIPFRLGLSGNANYYVSGLTGRTYGWTVNVSTPAFFIRGLSADYVYSNNYDPYYLRDIVEQNGSLSLNWRAFTASARFRYSTFPLRVRELQLTIARPF